MRRRAFLLLGAGAVAACASTPPSLRRDALERERGRRHVPGAAVGSVSRGVPTSFDAFGELRSDTLTEACSLSKPIFAFAVVSGAVRGALDLDAPIAALAPPPYPHLRRGATDLFDDARLAAVTPRLLLSHRAGLPNWSRDRPLAFEAAPGERWRYSGEGYVLLQRALERGRGEPLEALARRAVFAPLAMTRSTFDPGTAIAPRTEGHDRTGAAVPSSLDAPSAATSLLSTVEDLARFARRIVDAPADDPIVSAMLAPQVSVDDTRRIEWGLGLALAAPDWFFHWGASPGFRALMVGSRSRGRAEVIVTNGEGGMELAAEIVRARLADLPLLTFPMLYPPD